MIWWTEHDFRVQVHGHRQGVRFDGMIETENELDWAWTQGHGRCRHRCRRHVRRRAALARRAWPGVAAASHRAGDDWGWLTFDGEAWNPTYSTCLADTTVELDVLSESIGPDAELVVEILCSYRPATGGRSAGHYSLQYRIGSSIGWSTEDSGRRGVIASRGANGWQRLRLRPVDDITPPTAVIGAATSIVQVICTSICTCWTSFVSPVAMPW